MCMEERLRNILYEIGLHDRYAGSRYLVAAVGAVQRGERADLALLGQIAEEFGTTRGNVYGRLKQIVNRLCAVNYPLYQQIAGQTPRGALYPFLYWLAARAV